MRIMYLVGIALLLSCQSNDRKYAVTEDEMLYVKAKPSPDSRNFVFVDRFGQQRIPHPDFSKRKDEFIEAHEFSYGLALVRGYDHKWRYINRKGETVIEASYDRCWSFGEFHYSGLGLKGLARVNNGATDDSFRGSGWNEGGKYGLIDIKGRVVLPVEYEEIVNFNEHDRRRWSIKKEGVWGLMDDKAKVLVPPQFDKLKFMDGVVYVRKGNYEGILDKDGKVNVPLQYDSIGHISSDSIYAFKDGKAILMTLKGKVLSRDERDLKRRYWKIRWDFE